MSEAFGSTAAVVDALLDFIGQDGCSDEQFNELALRLFGWQFARNEPFRRFCQGRGAAPRNVKDWRAIPAVPIDAFKQLTLRCQEPGPGDRVFMTSGTTRADMKGRHYHPTLAVYDRSMLRNFEPRFMAGRARLPMAILFPDEAELPNSSLAHYLALAAREFGGADSRSFVSVRGLDLAALERWLAQAQGDGQACALLGASYSFVHVIDAFAQRGLAFALPAGSSILDTGGYKGNSRELPLEAFYAGLSRTFGVPRERCINMYGMTELSTQFYDCGNALLPSVKSGGHWIRSRVVDPLSGREVDFGAPGILAHCDLANFNSVTTILTEDVGVAVAGGFQLLGRAQGAQARGCSLAVEEFIGASA